MATEMRNRTVAIAPSPRHRPAPQMTQPAPAVPPLQQPHDVETAWRARAEELQALVVALGQSTPSDEQSMRANMHSINGRRDDELLYHLKRVSAARARARAIELNSTVALTPHASMPIQVSQGAVDTALSSARHQFHLRSPRPASREKAVAAAYASIRDATAADPAGSADLADPIDPAMLRDLLAHQPAPQRDTAAPHTSGPTRSVQPHFKRTNNQKFAPGQRAYASWVKREGALRTGLVKELGQDAADNIVLTGNTRMAGKITSLNMISQGLAQQKKVVVALKEQPCFRTASSVHLAMISTVAVTRFHSRYSVIYREGASANTFYVLVQGALQHTSHEGRPVVQRVDPTGESMICFGTEGVTGGMPRSTTATCLDDCEVLHFTTYRMRLSEEGVEMYARRAFATFVEAELQKMPIFFGLKSSVLFGVSTMFELREYASANMEIYGPGMVSDAIYILAKGRVVIEDEEGLQLIKLQADSVEEGVFFGEQALLEGAGAERTTSAMTRTPTKLLVLRRAHFARILRLVPGLRHRMRQFHKKRQSEAVLARLAAAGARERRDRENERRASMGHFTRLDAQDAEELQHRAAAHVQFWWRRATAVVMGVQRLSAGPAGRSSGGASPPT